MGAGFNCHCFVFDALVWSPVHYTGLNILWFALLLDICTNWDTVGVLRFRIEDAIKPRLDLFECHRVSLRQILISLPFSKQQQPLGSFSRSSSQRVGRLATWAWQCGCPALSHIACCHRHRRHHHHRLRRHRRCQQQLMASCVIVWSWLWIPTCWRSRYQNRWPIHRPACLLPKIWL